MKQSNLATHTLIVYTTAISMEIKSYYVSWKYAKERGLRKESINIAFHEFVMSCERENKKYLSVMDELINYHHF
jgi:hypothetical protein